MADQIVPEADGSQDLGTDAKRWGAVKAMYASIAQTDGQTDNMVEWKNSDGTTRLAINYKFQLESFGSQHIGIMSRDDLLLKVGPSRSVKFLNSGGSTKLLWSGTTGGFVAPDHNAIYLSGRVDQGYGRGAVSISNDVAIQDGDYALKVYASTKNYFNIFGEHGYAGFNKLVPTATLHGHGTTSDDTAYALKLDDSSDVNLLSVRNDGVVAAGGDLAVTGSVTVKELLRVDSGSDSTFDLYRNDFSIRNNDHLGTISWSGRDENGTGATIVGEGSDSWTVGSSPSRLTFGVCRTGESVVDNLIRLSQGVVYLNSYGGLTSVGGDLAVTGSVTEQGIYAEIHVHDNTTAQSIPSGATYTKITAYDNDGLSSNCTADSANDKITFTKTGVYKVSCSCNFSDGTNNTVWKLSPFLNAVEQDQIHVNRKISTAGDVGSATMIGLIDVTTVGWDIDIRASHDGGAAVDITMNYSNLTVEYVGEA